MISDGRLVTGAGNNAGEFGHISVAAEGPPCACGNRGCLENYASGPAIAACIRGQKPGKKETYSAEEAARDADAGDPTALQAFVRAGHYLGIGVTNVIHLMNPGVIVFGGGVVKAAHLLLPSVKNTVAERTIPSMYKQVELKESRFAENAGVLGAASLFYGKKHSLRTLG
jgi:glucokinase